jgi:hypothetical protein
MTVGSPIFVSIYIGIYVLYCIARLWLTVKFSREPTHMITICKYDIFLFFLLSFIRLYSKIYMLKISRKRKCSYINYILIINDDYNFVLLIISQPYLIFRDIIRVGTGTAVQERFGGFFLLQYLRISRTFI